MSSSPTRREQTADLDNKVKVEKANCRECHKQLDKVKGDKIFGYLADDNDTEPNSWGFVYCESCAYKWVKPEYLIEL